MANLSDPDVTLVGSNLGQSCYKVVAWACFAVATVFIALRVFVRVRHNRTLFPDDFWMLFAWVSYVVMLVLQMKQVEPLYYAVYYISGLLDLSDPEMYYQAGQFLNWQFPISLLFLTTLWSVKASFLATFYRLVYPLRWARWAWWFIVAFTAGSYIGCIFTMLFMCHTPSDFFTPGGCQEPGKNWRHVFSIGFCTSVDVATDLMIVVLSLAVIKTLQLDKSKKYGVAVAFSLVIAIVVVSMVRIEMVVKGDNDVDLVGLAVWGVVETMTAIIVGSLMPLSGLLSRVFRKVGTKHSRSRSRRTASSKGSNHQPSISSQMRESTSNPSLRQPPFEASRATVTTDYLRSGRGSGSSGSNTYVDTSVAANQTFYTSETDETPLTPNLEFEHKWRNIV